MVDWWADNPAFTPGISFVVVFQEILRSIFAFYFISHLVFPLFFRKRYFLGLIGLLVPILLAPLINYIVFISLRKLLLIDKRSLEFIKYGLFDQNINDIFQLHKILHGIMPLVYSTMPAFIAKLLISIIGYFQEVNLLQHKEHELEKENLQLEINFLKSQMNPHFLFNSLNNIYAYVALNDIKALELITNLSEMLQYTLYGTKDSMVALEKELKFLENYINLEHIRYNDKNCTIEYNFNYNNVNKYRIAPLLLFPFVENSFKHGISTNKKNGWLKADAKMEGDILLFRIENNKRPSDDIAIDKKDFGGIGVSNTQRRLAVLYEQKHELLITETKDSYVVLLKITCTKNESKFKMFSC